jgi:hypothetical protein
MQNKILKTVVHANAGMRDTILKTVVLANAGTPFRSAPTDAKLISDTTRRAGLSPATSHFPQHCNSFIATTQDLVEACIPTKQIAPSRVTPRRIPQEL